MDEIYISGNEEASTLLKIIFLVQIIWLTIFVFRAPDRFQAFFELYLCTTLGEISSTLVYGVIGKVTIEDVLATAFFLLGIQVFLGNLYIKIFIGEREDKKSTYKYIFVFELWLAIFVSRFTALYGKSISKFLSKIYATTTDIDFSIIYIKEWIIVIIIFSYFIYSTVVVCKRLVELFKEYFVYFFPSSILLAFLLIFINGFFKYTLSKSNGEIAQALLIKANEINNFMEISSQSDDFAVYVFSIYFLASHVCYMICNARNA